MNLAKLLVVSLLAATSLAQPPAPYLPDVRYDEGVPTLAGVVGHDFGERVSSHAETERYLQALAAASPHVALFRYGASWEGRTLYYLAVGAPDNLARLEAIQAGMQALADPRGLEAARAEELVTTLPATPYLAYAVHGNEISGTDAALLTAYHLAAARGDAVVDGVLRDAVVLLDPLENPDGRDRFVHHFRQTVGRWPDADSQSAEHDEPWPGGRTNHYLFDMNRDWIALTQPETRARVATFLQWYPLVYVDLHEMGGDATYYFPPPAVPYNPLFTQAQLGWLSTFGRHNGRWFDRMRFDYFTREVFDAFYPGYGEGWPMFHGAIGMTYEQASVRGLVLDREDDTTLHYRDSVQRHFVASLATIETAAREREALLRGFLEFRRSAVEQGKTGVRAYLLPPGRDPDRVRELVGLLMAQGVEVHRAAAPLRLAAAKRLSRDSAQVRSLPAGTYVVYRAQPARRLADALLAREQRMDDAFVAEQERRRKKRLSTEIYDVTAWSLPLLWDVEAWTTEEELGQDCALVEAAPARAGGAPAEPAAVGYLVPWGTLAATRALAALFREDVRVFCFGKPFAQGGRTFAAGTLLVKTKNNPDDLHARLVRIAQDSGAEILGVDSSWTDSGIGFGSNNVRYLPRPRVALAWDRPTSSGSAGACRYVLEQVCGYPVTLVRSDRLGRAELDRYDVLVLPDARGGYGDALGGAVDRLKAWVRAGGTLVTLGEATRWLTEDKVGLLASERENRPAPEKQKPGQEKPGEDKAEPEPPPPFDLERAIQPDEELPDRIPGAVVRLDVDPEHWLAFGYEQGTQALANTRNVFTPIKLDKGRNVAVYAPRDRLVLAGLAWSDTADQLAQKAYLVHQPLGRGHVVAFAEDPNFRGMLRALEVMFLNALFFGPGF